MTDAELLTIKKAKAERVSEKSDLSPSSSADAKLDLSPSSDNFAYTDMTEPERRQYAIIRMAMRDGILQAEPARRAAKPSYAGKKDGSYWLRAIDETGRLIRNLDRAIWFGDVEAGSPDAGPFFRDELPTLDKWGKGFNVYKKWGPRFVPDHLLRRQWWYKRDDGLPYVSFKVPCQGGSRLFVTLKERAHNDIVEAARSLGASDDAIEKIHAAVLGEKCPVCDREKAIQKRYDELVSDFVPENTGGHMWVNGTLQLNAEEKASLRARAVAEIDAVRTSTSGGEAKKLDLLR